MLEYIGYQLYNKNKKKEGFSSESPLENLIFLIFNIFIGILCVYLSWSCNTSRGTETPLKILYALIAFIFGIFYIIFYLLVNVLGGMCGSTS